ncbi:hypothetical protein ACJZ2D_008315 [Fusarium nematophilum]
MLKTEDRFFAPSGAIDPGGPSTWHVVDWDQRRLISVTMDEELESEEPAFKQLSKHIDDLAPEVYEIRVSSQGDLISTSTNPEDDETRCVYHPPLEKIERPDRVQVVSHLLELMGNGPQLIFKYYFLFQHVSFSWHEMNLWMRLPKHPNIVAFDGLVVDELENRYVGFTTRYIPGGTLQENKTRLFKLKWLHQLTGVIDELNLNLGIAHQDVAPRNLLIDETSDSLMIFDFNFSARIGKTGYRHSRSDVKGVLFTMYEIITGDDSLRAVRYEDQDVSTIENVDWTKHPDVLLDHLVSEFRQVLREWCKKRRSRTIALHTDAPNFIDWPPLPEPPPSEVLTYYMDRTTSEMRVEYDWSRNELLEQGKTVLNWQRPPQRRLKAGDRVLATGKLSSPENSVARQPEPERGLRVLSLDGGGVRGLSSLYILRHLMKRVDPRHPPKPCDYFDIIGGTSTGGLIAIMLGRLRMSIPECIDRYKELSAQVFKPKRQHNILGKAKDLWKLDGAFDALALEAATRKVIQDAGMDPSEHLLERDAQCKVFVLAMRAEVTRPARLRSYETPLTVQEVDCTVVEAVRATSAASSFFSPVTIQGETFIDAAVGYNNPVDEVLEEVYQVYGTSGRNIERFVSVGTGMPSLKAFGKNFPALGKSLAKIATDTQRIAEKFERDAVRSNGLSGIYFRFNARGMEGVGLDDKDRMGAITSATNSYLNEPETLQKVNAFAALIPSFMSKPQQHAYLRSLRTYDIFSELSRVAEPVPGTFSWVLDTPELRSWCGDDAEGQPIFHILGKPGCGKSVLLAWLRHNLPETHIAFFACKHSEHIRRSPEMILSSLLRQILEKQPNLFRYTVPLTSCLESWTYAQLWASFKSVLTSPDNTGVICMIDALDECLKETQKQFVKDLWLLSDLITRKRSRGYARLIITSRNYVDLHIPSATSLNLDKSPKMTKDLETFIGVKVEELVGLRPQYAELESLIVNQLQGRAKGMYRLVELIIEELYSISDSSTESILDTLLSVPDDIGELYDSIWERVPPGHFGRARAILAWILCSFTPLDVGSFGHVVAALKKPEASIEEIESTIPTDVTGDLRRLLGPLVSVGDTVEVSHPTVKDHFLESEEEAPSGQFNRVGSSEAHALIALTCLRYLNSFQVTDLYDYDTRGFVPYALANFSSHVARAGENDALDQEIAIFFEKAVWLDEWQQSPPRNLTNSVQIPRIEDAISFSTYYGRPTLLRSLISEHPKFLSCPEGICAKDVLRLVYLASVGLQERCLQVVIVLFDNMLFTPGLSIKFCAMAFGVDDEAVWLGRHQTTGYPDMADYIHSYQLHNQQFQRTDEARLWLQYDILAAFRILCPFQAASTEQDLVLLRSHDWAYSAALLFTQYMLSTYGPGSIDILDYDNPALLEAVCSNMTHAVQYLVAVGADLGARDRQDASILHLAAKTGNMKIVQLLLEQKYLDVNATDREGRTPLHYACSRYDLWDDMKTSEPRPPFISRAKVVALLLKYGAERKARDHRGNTPFQTLGRVFVPDWDDIPKNSDLNWREDDLNETVAMLMQDLSDVAGWDHRGATVLHHAAWRWPISAMEQLLQFLESWRVSPCLLDHHGHTPLHYAALRGFDSPQKAVEVLCKAGVDPRIRQIWDGSALAVARHFSRASCIKELEEWEKKFDTQADAATRTSWLRDRFGVDASEDHAQIRSQRAPRKVRALPSRLIVVAATQQCALAQRMRQSSAMYESEDMIHPSMEIGIRMAETIRRNFPDVSQWQPTVLPRQFVEGFTFIQYDLSRQGGLGHLADESLSRPISRIRLEKSGLIDDETGKHQTVQDVNYYSLTRTASIKSESGPVQELEPNDNQLSYDGEGEHWEDEEVAWSDTDYEGDDLNDEWMSPCDCADCKDSDFWVRCWIMVIILHFIGCLLMFLDEMFLEAPRFPLGESRYQGRWGFQKLQRSGRDWEWGDRLDGGWVEYSVPTTYF